MRLTLNARIPLLIACLVAVSLAGCADETPAAGDGGDEAFEDLDSGPVASDKGLIRGIVVDETISPVADVKVVLVGADLEMRTNAQGAFLFSDLEPGPYFVKASAIGYHTQQSNTIVEAGVEKPPIVRILLEPNPAGVPWHSGQVVDGYIECSFRTPAAGVAACGGVRDFTGVGEDTYSAIYETGSNITHLQTEMVWRNTQSLGDAFSVNHRYATQEQYDGGFYTGGLTSGKGQSPLLIVTPAEDYNAKGVGVDFKFMTSVFATDSATAPGFGAAIQQRYSMYVDEFHGYAPPEGWRISDGGDIPDPQ